MTICGQGESSGKIILMGEHAVIYGEPAIAFPFYKTKVTASFEELIDLTKDQLVSSYYMGGLSKTPHALKNIKVLLTTLKKDYPFKEKIQLTIKSTIPSERGMGSSAAVATAITRAYFDFLDIPLSRDNLLKYVQISEKITHGNPSGIDAAATSSLEPIYFTKEHFFDYFSLNIDAFLIIADTGIKGQTRETVKDVANLFKKNQQKTRQKIQQLGYLTKQAKIAIIENTSEKLAQTMNEAQQILQKLTVSNEFLDHLIQTALDAGAIGAKLTGGGRGGCMIALAQTKMTANEINKALLKAGAVKTWIQGLGAYTHV